MDLLYGTLEIAQLATLVEVAPGTCFQDLAHSACSRYRECQYGTVGL